MKTTKGLTVYICFGSYGGFRIVTDDLGFRITLGIMSIAIVPRDIENMIYNMNELIKKLEDDHQRPSRRFS